jgi:hypothetical protein
LVDSLLELTYGGEEVTVGYFHQVAGVAVVGEARDCRQFVTAHTLERVGQVPLKVGDLHVIILDVE